MSNLENIERWVPLTPATLGSWEYLFIVYPEALHEYKRTAGESQKCDRCGNRIKRVVSVVTREGPEHFASVGHTCGRLMTGTPLPASYLTRNRKSKTTGKKYTIAEQKGHKAEILKLVESKKGDYNFLMQLWLRYVAWRFDQKPEVTWQCEFRLHDQEYLGVLTHIDGTRYGVRDRWNVRVNGVLIGHTATQSDARVMVLRSVTVPWINCVLI